MLQIVLSAPTLQRACDDLILAARSNGGDDNITCLLLRMVEQPWYYRFLARKKGTLTWQNSI